MATNYDSWSGFSAGTNIVGNGYTRRGEDFSGSPTVTSDTSGKYEDDLYVALTAAGSNPITPDGASSATGLQQSFVRVRPQTTTAWSAVVYVRVATSGDTMYGFGMTSDLEMRLFKVDDGAFSTLDIKSVTSFAVDDEINLRLEVDDSGSDAVLTGTYWPGNDNADPQTTYVASYTDPTPITQGWPGFGQRQQTSEARFDVFSWGTDEVAPLSGSLATPTNFSFSAASSSLQLDGSWSPVADADTYDWQVERDDAGSWVAFQSGNTASTSFALDDTDGVDWSTTYRARARAVPPVA